MAEFVLLPGRIREIKGLAAASSSISCNYRRIVMCQIDKQVNMLRFNMCESDANCRFVISSF